MNETKIGSYRLTPEQVQEEIVLAVFQQTVRKSVLSEWLQHPHVEAHSRALAFEATEALELYFSSFVAGERPQLFRYPATWWDAFKERWFPNWLLRYFPSQYRQVWTIQYPITDAADPNIYYPQLPIPASDGSVPKPQLRMRRIVNTGGRS